MQDLLERQVPTKVHNVIKPDSIDEISFYVQSPESTEGPHFIRKRKAIKLPSSLPSDPSYEDYRKIALQLRELEVSKRLGNIDHQFLNERQKIALDHIIAPKTFTMFVKKMASFSILQVEMLSRKVEGKNFPPEKDQLSLDNMQMNMQLLADMFDLLLKEGIDHFDTYDENTLIGTNGEIYLLDFDRARFDKDADHYSAHLSYLNYAKTYAEKLKEKYLNDENDSSFESANYILERIVEQATLLSTSRDNDNFKSCSDIHDLIFKDKLSETVNISTSLRTEKS